MLWNKQPPIYEIIDEFTAWKSERYPWIAGAQQSLLYRFAKTFKLDKVEDIGETHLAFFVGQELTAFYGAQALKAIRAFLWYCKRAGYNVLSPQMATEEKLRKAGRPVEWDMVRKVKELKEGRGLSYNEVTSALSAVLKRKIHRNSVIRWYKQSPNLP